MRLTAPPLSVLIVSGSGRTAGAVASMLEPSEFAPVSVVNSGAEARRELVSAGYDIVMISAPLPDEFGDELAMDTAARGASAVLLIVRDDIAEEVGFRVEEYGVVTLAKPVSPAQFRQSLKMCAAFARRIRRYEDENEKLRVKIDDIKLIERAKWALRTTLGMSEEQAHRYIEKQAMDRRASKREVAEAILRTYESGG